jgi:hypothetical protein
VDALATACRAKHRADEALGFAVGQPPQTTAPSATNRHYSGWKRPQEDQPCWVLQLVPHFHLVVGGRGERRAGPSRRHQFLGYPVRDVSRQQAAYYHAQGR